MCSCDNPMVLDSSTVRAARKRHTCANCSQSIEPGARYLRVEGRWAESGFDSFALCLACESFGDRLGAAGICWGIGVMDEALEELEDAVLLAQWRAHLAQSGSANEFPEVGRG